MSQKLTLARYLEGRGSVKSLTRIEAEAFGVPYPLVAGWPSRYGDMEITKAMLDDLSLRIGRARKSTASKALRGLDGACGPSPVTSGHESEFWLAEQSDPMPALHVNAAPSLNGFAVRLARRYRSRNSRS